jgi:membrane protein DedA with SNARE-associated domain
MAEWVISTIQQAGYSGIIFLMFLENIFPPIPSELIMPLAGFMAAEGKLHLVGIIIAGTFGSLLGALPLYYAGFLLGEERLKAFVDKYGRWLTVTRHEIVKSKQWFDRHGRLAVLICRFVPAVRSLISIPAGLAKMSLVTFLLYTVIGSAIWTSLLVYAGYILGAKFEKVREYLNPVSNIVLATIFIFYVKRLFASTTKRGR